MSDLDQDFGNLRARSALMFVVMPKTSRRVSSHSWSVLVSPASAIWCLYFVLRAVDKCAATKSATWMAVLIRSIMGKEEYRFDRAGSRCKDFMSSSNSNMLLAKDLTAWKSSG